MLKRYFEKNEEERYFVSETGYVEGFKLAFGEKFPDLAGGDMEKFLSVNEAE